MEAPVERVVIGRRAEASSIQRTVSGDVRSGVGNGHVSDKESFGKGYDSAASRRSGRSSDTGRSGSARSHHTTSQSEAEKEQEQPIAWKLPDVPSGSATIVVEHKGAVYLLAVSEIGLAIHPLQAVTDTENRDNNSMQIDLAGEKTDATTMPD
jgi:hypothetical protein